jgi:hypothetical protein
MRCQKLPPKTVLDVWMTAEFDQNPGETGCEKVMSRAERVTERADVLDVVS